MCVNGAADSGRRLIRQKILLLVVVVVCVYTLLLSVLRSNQLCFVVLTTATCGFLFVLFTGGWLLVSFIGNDNNNKDAFVCCFFRYFLSKLEFCILYSQNWTSWRFLNESLGDWRSRLNLLEIHNKNRYKL